MTSKQFNSLKQRLDAEFEMTDRTLEEHIAIKKVLEFLESQVNDLP